MSVMQSEVYECARNTAAVKIDNSEWINDFSGGIKLNKGDNVRILGSFVHEGSSGEEIELTQNTEVNVAYSPYIIGATIGTSDPNTNLIDLGMIADVPQSTDGFGIEPPARIDIADNADTNVPNYPFPTGDAEAYGNPLATGFKGTESTNKPFGSGRTLFNTQNDFGVAFGTNLVTNEFNAEQRTSNALNLKNYKNFSLRSVPNEFYISQMVKKFILPMNKGHYNENGVTGSAVIPEVGSEPGIAYDWEDLIDNPVDGQPGMFSGVPKPGMCFTTVDVGAGSGFYDDSGEAWYENFWGAPGDATAETNSPAGSCRFNGLPNLKTGCQSMIGTIIAVRPIKHNMAGHTVGCFEILVSDWVNPAALVKKGMLEINMPVKHLTQMDSFAGGIQVVNTEAGRYYKKVHGSGELPNGYNNNPSWNNINGAYTQMNVNGYYLGMNSGTPSQMGYQQANYQAELVGGASEFPTKYQKGYGMPQGLSFPWNGSHCGGVRQNVPVTTPVTNVDSGQRYRANSVMYWREEAGELYSNNFINDTFYTPYVGPGSNPHIFENSFMQPGSTPVCFGGYLICNKDTMLKVAKGEYDITTDPAGNYYSAMAGRYPKVWFEMSNQINESDYTTRHYINNSWINSGGTNLLNTPSNADTRYGYAMCGQPPNVNWRITQGARGAPSVQRMVYDFQSGLYPTGMGANQSNINTTKGDGMPRYWSSQNGTSVFWGPTGPPQVGANNGDPVVWGGYNNCLNSIHFQAKDTGDVNLGLSTNIICDGFTDSDTTAYNGLGVGPQDVMRVNKASLINRKTGAVQPLLPRPGNDWYVQIHHDVGGLAVLMIDAIRVGTLNDVGLYYEVGISTGVIGTPPNRPLWRFMQDFPAGTKVTFFCADASATSKFQTRGASFLGHGAGKDMIPWAGDCLMIRQNMTKIQVPAGYYTEEQLAEKINDGLHLSPNEYKKQFGVKLANGQYAVPSTIGIKERAFCSEPSVVNGNFTMTYIPEVSYGFSPVTEANAEELDMDASTKFLNDVLYTYDSQRDGGGDLIFYYLHELPAYNGTTVRKITDPGTKVGTHVKFYSIPHLSSSGTFNPQIQLLKLKGGAYNKADFSDPTGSGSGISTWNQVIPRWAGTYEMLRDNKGNLAIGGLPSVTPTSLGIYNYRCRLVRNMISYGGGAKLFCGANNISFSWMEGANRFSLNNLYTPLRPHERDDPNNKNQDFGIDDAVPSSVINSKHTGTKLGQLSGIYIDDLNAEPLTVAEWGEPTIGDNWIYDTVTVEQQQTLGQTFLDTLGFTAEQVAAFSNDFATNVDPFVFNGELEQSGTTIRVGPKITTAVNGSNPFASNCLNIVPVAQFFVEVDTGDFFATNVPLKGNDPYYFIGSDFPSKKFYGNQTGAKLPVIGICSRNFHSFNFVFDLGGSSISYTIEEDCTIQSIRTKIYTSSLQTPKSLSPYSAVIYLITRNNYIKSIPQALVPDMTQLVQENAARPMQPIPFGYNQAPANYRTSTAFPNKQFEESDGERPQTPVSPTTSDDDY